MENFLWSVHLTVGWCTSADLLCLYFSYTPIYILYIGTSQSKKLFIAPSMYKALYWHSEGQKDERKSLLCGRRGKKSRLLLEPSWMPSTISQALGLLLFNLFSQQSYMAGYFILILWIRELRLRETTDLSLLVELWSPFATWLYNLFWDQCPKSILPLQKHRRGQKTGSIRPLEQIYLHLLDTRHLPLQRLNCKSECFPSSHVQVWVTWPIPWESALVSPVRISPSFPWAPTAFWLNFS